jgi:hypothetical protein
MISLLLAFALMCLFSGAQSTSPVNQIKAVFLFNFTQFINWPPTSYGGATSPFVIAVLGNDPFGAYLESVVENEKVEGRRITVQRYTDLKDVKQCHILFINKENAGELAKEMGSRSILTVSDTGNFARDGGIIGFYLDNNKIRLQINTKAARAANLTISSKLLRLANIIDN